MFTNPSRVAFEIGNRPVYWYGILLAASVLAAMFFALKSAKRYRWKEDDMIDVCLLAVPLGVVFARIYYVVFSWSTYASNPLSILYLWEGGLAIYGALLGGVIGVFIYARWKKRSIIELMDVIFPGVALAQAIGRWGNFINQEAFGIEITNKAWMWFPFAVRIDATNTIHYATFFYESLWCLGIFFFLWFYRSRFTRRGDVVAVYAMLYGFERALIEGLRTDSLMLGPLRISQIVSALLFVGIAVYFVIRRVKYRANPLPITNPLNPGYSWPDEVEKAPEEEEPLADTEPAVEAEAAAETEPAEETEP